ncbi:hypothetical protein BB560_001682 [Smittium megazygosporum]|uniref:Uncharacterized protein n=1 Tax=Smittium megazygosporum TaxID=133381 RepID=A0A2T9ZGW8_9FUNG|nr:hypothetical protein BB560_001682 [Smittium megazygosporum]
MIVDLTKYIQCTDKVISLTKEAENGHYADCITCFVDTYIKMMDGEYKIDPIKSLKSDKKMYKTLCVDEHPPDEYDLFPDQFSLIFSTASYYGNVEFFDSLVKYKSEYKISVPDLFTNISEGL